MLSSYRTILYFWLLAFLVIVVRSCQHLIQVLSLQGAFMILARARYRSRAAGRFLVMFNLTAVPFASRWLFLRLYYIILAKQVLLLTRCEPRKRRSVSFRFQLSSQLLLQARSRITLPNALAIHHDLYLRAYLALMSKWLQEAWDSCHSILISWQHLSLL